jgi:two-component system response regulator NreC
VAKIRLVLADKYEIFLEGLAKLLKSNPGIEVVCTCCTGLETVENAFKYQPDVILMDTRLLECSGIEVAQRIHEELLKTNIIMLTHSETDEDLISATRAGAKAYLSKDISIESLTKAIILVAEGGVVVSSPMAARLLQEFNFLEESKDAAKLITLLSKREQAVLSLVAQGFTNKEIATTLVICENTVKAHLRNIMEKLHANTRQQAVSLVGGKDLLPRVTQTDTKQA